MPLPALQLFTVSFSVLRMASQCWRRLWLRKVAAWNGWKDSAAEQKRLAYRLSKAGNLWMVSGRIVHDLAHRIVLAGIDERQALAEYRQQMREAWKTAQRVAGGPNPSPKHNPDLFEMYYRGHRAADPTELAALGRKVFERGENAIRNVFRSLPLQLVDSGEAEVLEAEDRTVFFLQGDGGEPVECFVQVDLLLKAKTTLVVDWKGGGLGNVDPLQPALYGLYVERVYGETEPTALVYSLRDGEPQWYRYDREQLADVESVALTRARGIQEKLDPPRDAYAAPAERFPRTEDLRECLDCALFAACKGHRDLSRPEYIAPGFDEEEPEE